MAATDKPYRNQYRLDIVFGASCIVLLLTTVWMFYDDHFRPFKPIQRTFRDVEEALYTQQLAEKTPSEDRLGQIEGLWKKANEARDQVKAARGNLGQRIREAEARRQDKLPDQMPAVDPDRWLKDRELEKARLEADYQNTKATYDSEVSLYNILIDQRDATPGGSYKDKLDKQAQEKKAANEKIEKELQEIQNKITKNQQITAEALAEQKEAEDQLARIDDDLRKMTNEFDRTAKLAAQKRWKIGDWFRALPIIDGFASPYRIQQISLEDLTIEYGSFKNVPRYDRCTTCHLSIDRASFTADALRRLDLEDKKGDSDEIKKAKETRRAELQKRYQAALDFLNKREVRNETLGFVPGDLAGKVPSVRLSDAQVKMYSAHPRLDLYVDANSPHPIERFGCTICHGGQGSATEFYYAAHTPNDVAQKKEWEKEHKWEMFHDWEFPMLPHRFVESGCVKCHHQMTDLIQHGSLEEAPKLLRGYNLVKEYGCFGCHEISGIKSGKAVGPDLRLEPSPAVDQLSPEERAKLLSDPGNPPGTMRKVGPALRRLSEKTNEEWVRQWVNSPRGFRPDTRMPHFYHLSTNSTDVLPPEQKDFPATEISSIAHYLIKESQDYLHGTDRFHVFNEKRRKELQDSKDHGTISDKQAKELIEVERRLEQWKVPTPVELQIVDADGKPIPPAVLDPILASDTEEDRKAGQQLFTERGCLACHSHAGTEKGRTPVAGEAHFGPNLSRLAAKIKGENSRRWLVQWILNPNISHPRTRMPIMHLSTKEAVQVADWLLSQKVTDWKGEDVPEPSKENLVNLARVFLKKAPAINPLKIDDILEKGITDQDTEAPTIAYDADERALMGPIDAERLPERLKYYIGKKAVGRMGCFACHDVPGFEYAKPIGTPLNDWGKKDPARLAFEDIVAFVKAKYEVVPERDDPKDKSKPSKEWAKAVEEGKKPYEQFFFEALAGHLREGFLHQKLEDPRSYDYNRDLKWDDRLRMPQFRFAHPKQEKGESDEEFKARADMEQDEAREAVMTFILGLVAEPIHPRYLNNPPLDRLAEVKGRQVLEKFNCAGCHQIRPGVYDVKLDYDDREGGSRALLDSSYRDIVRSSRKILQGDIPFPQSNAWASTQPPNADRLLIHAVDPRPREGNLRVQLTQAIRFESLPLKKGDQLIAFNATDKDKATLDGQRELLTIPSGLDVEIDPATFNAHSETWGGTFANLMVDYLMAKNKEKYNSKEAARAGLPPPLVREGERVQPEWLFGFLRNPTPIRPFTVGSESDIVDGQTVIKGGLRMPKFNMSEEDAQAIVNYFAAADKINNPGIGLTYPYLSQPERQETYWQDRNREYVKLLADRKELENQAKQYLKEAEERLKAAKDGNKDKADLEDVVNRLKEALGEKDANKQQALLAQTDLYWVDGYRLLTMPGNNAVCLKCHNIGRLKANDQQGPQLELASRRLRPGWTEQWIANPKRLFTYEPTMPQPFKHGQDDFMEFFNAPSRQKVQALRDVLMNYPKVANLPFNRTNPPAPSGGK
jgi:mono/diheme cytochrome c family protein